MDSFHESRSRLPPLSSSATEASNPRTREIDEADTEEICRIIHEEGVLVTAAVAEVVPKVANAINEITQRIKSGGRVFYMGAGTSGRLGVLDAIELPPTFGTDPSQFIALIAGGDHALRTADEDVEDSRVVGVTDLNALQPTPNDTVIGISASGTTPYVLGGLERARSCGLFSIGLVCVRPSRMEIEGNCQIIIDPLTGPEVIAGSTRMKAGTATKMILNMISTGVQIKLGQTHGNLMIGVRASSTKSKERARQIIRTIASEFTLPPTYSAIIHNDEQLNAVLERCGGKVKLALVVIVSGWGIDLCEDALARRGGVLKMVLEDVRYETIIRVFNR